MKNLDDTSSRAVVNASVIVTRLHSSFRWSPTAVIVAIVRTMTRYRFLVPSITLLAAFVLPPVAPAKHLPDPTFKTLDGQPRKLSSLHGQIVVVNFWATWCGPCQEELPRLALIAASYAGKPVSFVFISIDATKDRAKIPGALARLHVSFDSWVNADTDTLDRFGLGEIVPGTIVLDENGEPVARVMGEAKEEDVRNAVNWLLDGRKGDPPAAISKRY